MALHPFASKQEAEAIEDVTETERIMALAEDHHGLGPMDFVVIAK